MLQKTEKPEDLAGSYRSLNLATCLGKLLEKTVGDNRSNWAEGNKSLMNNKIVLEKTGAHTIIYLKFLKQLNLVFVRTTELQEYFLMSTKSSTKFGMKVFSLS